MESRAHVLSCRSEIGELAVTRINRVNEFGVCSRSGSKRIVHSSPSGVSTTTVAHKRDVFIIITVTIYVAISIAWDPFTITISSDPSPSRSAAAARLVFRPQPWTATRTSTLSTHNHISRLSFLCFCSTMNS